MYNIPIRENGGEEMTSIAICYPFCGTEEYAKGIGLFEAFGEGERARIDAISSLRARDLSLRGLIALKYLADRTEVQGELEIQRGDNGKPYFKNSPYFFNISHSGDISVAAISSRRVGVDIERVLSKPSFPKIAKRFFSEAEYLRYKESRESAEEFYRIWTAKEAVVKYKGASLAQSLSEGEMKDTEVHLRSFSLKYNDDIYIITVCLPCDEDFKVLDIDQTTI